MVYITLVLLYTTVYVLLIVYIDYPSESTYDKSEENNNNKTTHTLYKL